MLMGWINYFFISVWTSFFNNGILTSLSFLFLSHSPSLSHSAFLAIPRKPNKPLISPLFKVETFHCQSLSNTLFLASQYSTAKLSSRRVYWPLFFCQFDSVDVKVLFWILRDSLSISFSLFVSSDFWIELINWRNLSIW